MESSRIEISGNTVDGAQYGVRLSCGSSDNRVYENSFEGIEQGKTFECTVRVDAVLHERFRNCLRCSCQSYGGSRVSSPKFRVGRACL